MAIQVGEETCIVADFEASLHDSDDFQVLSMTAPFDPDRFPVGFKGPVAVFIAKGRFARPDFKGQSIELHGEWRYDNVYKNYAFTVQYIIPTLPTTKEGVFQFIKTMSGIGPVTAKAVYERYGSDLALAVEDISVLIAEVKGMTQNKASVFCNIVKRINVIAELTKLLQDNIPGMEIRAIAARYGQDASKVVSDNPYKMTEDKVVSFETADKVAIALGWDRLNERRLRAGILCAMRTIKFQTSAIIVDKTSLHRMSKKLLDVDESALHDMYDTLREERVIVTAGKYWYIYEDYLTEYELGEKVVEYITKGKSDLDAERFNKAFNRWQKKHPDIHLADKQQEGVRSVANNYISVVTGGPGTGKTTVLKAVMETYKEAFGKNGTSPPITLMAPTGLAAKRMAESCGRRALTIHKQLGLIPADNEAGFNDDNGMSIDGGLVIIDELSMLGIHLFKFVMDAVVLRQDTRIVLVGDIDQLPPVSPGAVLADLITSKQVQVTRLTKNFRQEAGSAIVDAAYAINDGTLTNETFDQYFSDKNTDLRFRDAQKGNLEDEVFDIIEKVKLAFGWSIKKYTLEQTYVLTPQRKTTIKDGRVTVETMLSSNYLNPILRDIANPASADKKYFKSGKRTFREGDRVINLKNTNEVINGDIGTIVRVETGDLAKVIVDFYGTEVEYTPDKLSALDLAYCITVHKSQGCEFDSVIYPTSMTQGVMLQRNLLYTAVTRAKKHMLMIGSRESVLEAVRRTGAKTKRDLLAARIVRFVEKKLAA